MILTKNSFPIFIAIVVLLGIFSVLLVSAQEDGGGKGGEIGEQEADGGREDETKEESDQPKNGKNEGKKPSGTGAGGSTHFPFDILHEEFVLFDGKECYFGKDENDPAKKLANEDKKEV